MASIPNLNTLRTGRRGPRLRGRRGGVNSLEGSHGSGSDEAELHAARDKVIQQTDQDASSSRMSAVAAGYLEDEFTVSFFPVGQEIPKRYPIINRGTYVRTKAIDKLVTRFLDTQPNQRKQIISLGAGSDTRYFRMCAQKEAEVVYHELDFEANVYQKRATIRSSGVLSKLTVPKPQGSSYHLHALDLRDLTAKSPPVIPNFEEDLPTLILSECCLCYLPPDIATSVVQYFTMNLKGALAMVLYEPIGPFDPFGKTMVTNLASRGIHMQTIKRYASLEAERQRLRLAGLSDGQGARDVHQIWASDEWISAAERERIEKVEWLDEVEEWKLLASHYCVAWGWRGEIFSAAWQNIDGKMTTAENNDLGRV